jgi:hypothetical protein
LRALRKAVSVLIGLCARCAKLFQFLLGFARVAQGCFSSYWGLRTLRKGVSVLIGVCARCGMQKFRALTLEINPILP